MTTDVSRLVYKMTIIEFLELVYLLVGKNYISSECLSHQEFFAKCSRSFSKNFIRECGNYSAKSKYKVVDHLLVKIKCRYGIWNRISGQLLRLVFSVRYHQFRIYFDWVIAKLSFSDCFETLWALRQVRISFNPIETVHVNGPSS